MKYPLYTLALLCVALLLTSCDDDDQDLSTSDYGWKLVAFYLDPGDGSGDFQPVSVFHFVDIDSATNRIAVSENLCGSDMDGQGRIQGSFDDSTGVITFDHCDRRYRLSVLNGELFIYHQCIEACIGKYEWAARPIHDGCSPFETYDIYAIHQVLEAMVIGMQPRPTLEDPIGHTENLILLTSLLNQRCPNLEFEFQMPSPWLDSSRATIQYMNDGRRVWLNFFNPTDRPPVFSNMSL